MTTRTCSSLRYMMKVRTEQADWATRVAHLLRAAPRTGPRVRVVAVEGRSGSGKSTVAEHVRRELAEHGEPAAVLDMDDLYPGWEGLTQAPALLREWVLGPLREGRPPAWHRYDWARGHFEERWRGLPETLNGGGTLLVEGGGSGAEAVRDLVDVLLWVEAPPNVRSARLDGREEDREAYAPFRRVWARQEEESYAGDHPRERADLVIDNP